MRISEPPPRPRRTDPAGDARRGARVRRAARHPHHLGEAGQGAPRGESGLRHGSGQALRLCDQPGGPGPLGPTLGGRRHAAHSSRPGLPHGDAGRGRDGRLQSVRAAPRSQRQARARARELPSEGLGARTWSWPGQPSSNAGHGHRSPGAGAALAGSGSPGARVHRARRRERALHRRIRTDTFGGPDGALRRLPGSVGPRNAAGGRDIARLGAGVQPLEQTKLLVERLRESLSLPFRIQGELVHVSATLGTAVGPRDGDSALTLVDRAYTRV